MRARSWSRSPAFDEPHDRVMVYLLFRVRPSDDSANKPSWKHTAPTQHAPLARWKARSGVCHLSRFCSWTEGARARDDSFRNSVVSIVTPLSVATGYMFKVHGSRSIYFGNVIFALRAYVFLVDRADKAGALLCHGTEKVGTARMDRLEPPPWLCQWPLQRNEGTARRRAGMAPPYSVVLAQGHPSWLAAIQRRSINNY